jgi:hypothetical protein
MKLVVWASGRLLFTQRYFVGRLFRERFVRSGHILLSRWFAVTILHRAVCVFFTASPLVDCL